MVTVSINKRNKNILLLKINQHSFYFFTGIFLWIVVLCCNVIMFSPLFFCYKQHINELSMKLDIEEILIKSEAIYLQLKNCKVCFKADY